MSDNNRSPEELQTYRWHSKKELLLQEPPAEREPWLKNELGILGMIAGSLAGTLLMPLLRVVHIYSTATWTLWFVAAIGAGYYLSARLPSYIGESASIDILGRVDCVIGKHDFKPDGTFTFLENGCECVRCHYRPSGRALLKVR